MTMSKTLQLLLLIAVFFALACEPEEEQISGQSNLKLILSTDTVLFDTLLTARTSITKRFRIKNPNQKAIRISDIRLAKGRQSDYTIIVNGKKDDSVQDEVVFGGDSLLVLVDVEIDPQDENMPYLVKDSVVVEWNGQSDHVKLVAYGQDAHFINAQAICDEVWTADRPYVIYNLALVDTSCTLTVEPGTRIYLDNSANFLIAGSLKVLGDSADRVVFRNTRFDEKYEQAPGQWSGIVFLESSQDNQISYCDIENGQIGLGVGYSFYNLDGANILLPESDPKTVDITIDHTSIRHMSTAGILAFSSSLNVSNTEIYNVGGMLVGNFAGGTYVYEHCTFVNTPSDFITDDPMVQLSDNLEPVDGLLLVEDMNATFVNSIIWGDGKDQIARSNEGGAAFEITLRNNIIRSTEPIEDNYVSQENNYPGFIDPLNHDYQLDSLAFARDKGVDIGIEDDLKGMPRDSKPDIGAFERIDKQ